uniref:HV80H14.11A n=1 Tax=Hordeum vulgare TaxID=4513 RepID=Q8L436_HORVU|nr:HV80H14.11B [Hordeum vulgare subsp. vulgare]AAM22822.1 HV80H14.11A [Hordeum vulgare subsp. vulgare]
MTNLGGIEGELGAFPYQRPGKNKDLADQGSSLGGAQTDSQQSSVADVRDGSQQQVSGACCSWSTSVRGAHRNVAVGALRLAPILGGAGRAKRRWPCGARGAAAAVRGTRSGTSGAATVVRGVGASASRASGAAAAVRRAGASGARRDAVILSWRWRRCSRQQFATAAEAYGEGKGEAEAMVQDRAGGCGVWCEEDEVNHGQPLVNLVTAHRRGAWMMKGR